jgi:DNA-binding transcriptional ArsR family regulator
MPTDVFGALASPVRRRILEELRSGPRAVNDLASRFQLGRPAISEHLQVLRSCGLVREEPRGRQRFYHLEPIPLTEVGDWLHPFEHYWRERLRALRAVLEEEQRRDLDDPL